MPVVAAKPGQAPRTVMRDQFVTDPKQRPKKKRKRRKRDDRSWWVKTKERVATRWRELNENNTSLYLFHERSRVRKRAWRIIRHPYFDKVVMAAIAVNCVLLAMYDPTAPDDSSWNASLAYAEHFFSAFFLGEFFVQIVARNFFIGPGAYLHNPWFRLDFVIVVSGTMTLVMFMIGASGGGNVSGMRTLRALKPLRTISVFPGMRVQVATILDSMPFIGSAMVLLGWLYVVYGVVGVYLYAGKLTSRCYAPESDVAIAEEANLPCGGAGGARSCATSEVCVASKGDYPNYGFTNFDDIAWASLTTFQTLTMRGWSDVMDQLEAATGSLVATKMYFITLIVFGSFFALSLVTAVIIAQYVRQSKLDEKTSGVEGAGGILNSPWFRRLKRKPWFVRAKRYLQTPWGWQKPTRRFVEHPRFNTAITFLILVNTATLASYHHGMDEGMRDTLETTNVLLNVAFAIEMVLKLGGLGLIDYFGDKFNVFDFVIVIVGILEMALQNGGLTVLRAFRLVRVLRSIRILRTYKRMKVLMENVAKGLGTMFWFSAVLLLFVFIFSVLGMQLFGGTAGFEDARNNFDDLGSASLAVFSMLTADGWHLTMWRGMSGAGSATALYFVSWMMLGHYVFVALFLAMIVYGFSQETEDERVAREERERLQKEAMYGPDGEKKKLARVKGADMLVDRMSNRKSRVFAREADAMRKWLRDTDQMYGDDDEWSSDEEGKAEEAAKFLLALNKKKRDDDEHDDGEDGAEEATFSLVKTNVVEALKHTITAGVAVPVSVDQAEEAAAKTEEVFGSKLPLDKFRAAARVAMVAGRFNLASGKKTGGGGGGSGSGASSLRMSRASVARARDPFEGLTGKALEDAIIAEDDRRRLERRKSGGGGLFSRFVSSKSLRARQREKEQRELGAAAVAAAASGGGSRLRTSRASPRDDDDDILTELIKESLHRAERDGVTPEEIAKKFGIDVEEVLERGARSSTSGGSFGRDDFSDFGGHSARSSFAAASRRSFAAGSASASASARGGGGGGEREREREARRAAIRELWGGYDPGEDLPDPEEYDKPLSPRRGLNEWITCGALPEHQFGYKPPVATEEESSSGGGESEEDSEQLRDAPAAVPAPTVTRRAPVNLGKAPVAASRAAAPPPKRAPPFSGLSADIPAGFGAPQAVSASGGSTFQTPGKPARSSFDPGVDANTTPPLSAGGVELGGMRTPVARGGGTWAKPVHGRPVGGGFGGGSLADQLTKVAKKKGNPSRAYEVPGPVMESNESSNGGWLRATLRALGFSRGDETAAPRPSPGRLTPSARRARRPRRGPGPVTEAWNPLDDDAASDDEGAGAGGAGIGGRGSVADRMDAARARGQNLRADAQGTLAGRSRAYASLMAAGAAASAQKDREDKAALEERERKKRFEERLKARGMTRASVGRRDGLDGSVLSDDDVSDEDDASFGGYPAPGFDSARSTDDLGSRRLREIHDAFDQNMGLGFDSARGGGSSPSQVSSTSRSAASKYLQVERQRDKSKDMARGMVDRMQIARGRRTTIQPLYNDDALLPHATEDFALPKMTATLRGGEAGAKKRRLDGVPDRDVVVSAPMKTAKRPEHKITKDVVEAQIFGSEPPPVFMKHSSLFVFKPQSAFRRVVFMVANDKRFEAIILTLIFLSAVALAIEDPSVEETSALGTVLFNLDVAFTTVFVVEMFSRIIAQGLIMHEGAYLRVGWNVLDGVIVVMSVVAILLRGSNLSIVRSFRTLRALRPLRMVRRLRSMQLLMATLLQCAPQIGNVMLLGLFEFVIFGILGVQLFGGKFWRCTDGSVGHVDQCSGAFIGADGVSSTRAWVNPVYNFDHVGQAMMSLFVIATMDGWVELAHRGMDAREVDFQPEKNYAPANVLFFVAFVLLGSLFWVNILLGVLIDRYRRIAAVVGDMNFVTEGQQRWAEALKMKQKQNEVVHGEKAAAEEPRFFIRKYLFRFVSHRYFEVYILFCIAANVAIMAAQHEGQSESFTSFGETMNVVFTVIFILECSLKVGALTFKGYLKDPWNRFDFVIVVGSLPELAGVEMGPGTTILRIFRMGRLFKILRGARSLRALFDSLLLTAPTLANVGGLLFLAMFIFAVLGMNLFGELPHGQFITDTTNFSTFGNSLMTLFKVLTRDGWSKIMIDALDCELVEGFLEGDYATSCGVTFTAPAFFVLFVLIASFVFLGLFVAVMLDEFTENATSEGLLSTSNFFDALQRKMLLDGFMHKLKLRLEQHRAKHGLSKSRRGKTR